MKSVSPSRTTAAHKTHTKIQAWSSLLFHCRHSSFNPSEAPPWDSRPVSGAGVVHYQLLHRPRSVPTALGPAPLVTYPHRPSQAGGYPRDCALLPPPPPSPGGARQGGRGVPGGKDRRGDRKGDGRMRSDSEERRSGSVRFPDTLPLGPQPAERLTRGAMRWYWTSLVDGLMLLRLLADGDGSSGRGEPAASPLFPAPPQTWRMAAGFSLQANGPTPPLPLGWQPPLLDPGARQRVFRPTCSSFAPAPPLRAATGGLRYFLLPDLLSTAIPLSSEGSLTACPSFLEVCTGSKLKPVPEIVWPDPSGTVKFRARTRPEITHPPTPPPPAPQRITKKKEKGCISRLHAKKRINQGSAISQTFTSYESLWTSGAAVAYICPSLWILYGQEDDDRANYGHFLSVKAR